MRTALAFLLAVSTAAAQEAPAPVELRVAPPRVRLDDGRDRQRIVVQAVLADGTTRDVSAEAARALADPAPAAIEGDALFPRVDGTTRLVIEYGGRSVEVPVEVAGSARRRPVTFVNDCLPVLTKGGCNSGSCHGASRGKDGFRLSLFGFDPAGDYHRLTREVPGRRIDRADPAASLVLTKATGAVRHTGGIRFGADGPLAATLLEWLQAGAPPDPEDLPRLEAVEIHPTSAVLAGEGASQRLLVLARYADGTDRDVTDLAAFFSSNDSTAAVGGDGVVRAGRRGEAFVMARFGEFTVGSQVLVVPDRPFEFPEVPEHNYVDSLVHAKLRKLRLVPSEVCDDATFLRRVSLDVTGTLPSPEDLERFVADAAPDKRARVVDELLGRKEFAEMWVMKWAERLQIRSSPQVSYKAMLLYDQWLEERIAGNVPIDRMVVELLGASGGVFESPAVNFYQAEPDNAKISENVAQVFLGMRIQCAQCHNHPFDRWTQDDYYGFAAFFAQIGKKRGEDPRETIVFNSGRGETKHPVTGAGVAPKFLGGPAPDVRGKDRRQVVAEWIASPENPWFSRNLANFVWTHFFGVGIVHEPDDVRVSNPPSNPELLDELARRFVEYGYDFKKLVRDICTSRTYQLSTRANETNALDERNFSRALVRRIRAEVLLDAISRATDTRDKFQGLPLGARAVQIADGTFSNYFLTTFGRAKRETVCTCEVSMEPNLSQALHLLNGETVHRKILEGKLIERRLAEGEPPIEVVDEIYLRCLARRPTEDERARLAAILAEGGDAKTLLEDVFWAVLNSREFLFNH